MSETEERVGKDQESNQSSTNRGRSHTRIEGVDTTTLGTSTQSTSRTHCSTSPSFPDHDEKMNIDVEGSEEEGEEETGEKLPGSLELEKFLEDSSDEEKVDLNPEHVGFTENELKTCVKVLYYMNYRRKLLSQRKFKKFFNLGKSLFGPLNPEEKKLRRKERKRMRKISAEIEDSQKLIKTEMKKKKLEEKAFVRQQISKRKMISLTPHFKPTMPVLKDVKEMLNMICDDSNQNTSGPMRIEELNDDKSSSNKSSDNEKEKISSSSSSTSPSSTPSSSSTPSLSSSSSSSSSSTQTSENTKKSDKELRKSKKCHICKRSYNTVHHFYDTLCTECGDLNFAKRNQRVDLTGKVALVTGGRIKIGYYIVVKLLQCGATVIMTTRFPKDAALRFQEEKDFDQWKDRLKIYGLDFRHIPSVVQFTEFFKSTFTRLDIIINNAAQTIRRPPIFYSHLLKNESKSIEEFPTKLHSILPNDFSMSSQDVSKVLKSLPGAELKSIEYKNNVSNDNDYDSSDDNILSTIQSGSSITPSAVLSQINLVPGDEKRDTKNFPPNVLDVNKEQVDLRKKNSWTMEITEVPIAEFLEVQTINSTAPFIICSRLKGFMSKDKNCDKFIVNVSSVEGQFYRPYKNTTHAHTNMAKASLNMMTRTCGAFFALDQIYMNSVDTGWVTEEKPGQYAVKCTVPLDEIDGASRVLDPIFMGYTTDKKIHSQFFKDYKIVYW